MKDDEPHSVQDNEPIGGPASTYIRTTRRKKKNRKSLIVSVGFDDNLKEFQLWDHLYDVKTEHFELDAIPDYKNRIQYYEIKADRPAIRLLIVWLEENNFKFKLDKK